MALDGSYAGLQASIADFLNRGDLSTVIPDFITLAEAQMARRLVSRANAGLAVPRRLILRADAGIAQDALYPNCKVLNVLAAGGEKGPALKALTRELEPCLLAWARASDCKYIIGFGTHEGWKPVTEAMGYALQWLVMIKEVKD
jgi:hypothetical protein